MKSRLLVTRLLTVGTLPLMIFSHHVHPEGHLVDDLLAASALILLLIASAGRMWASLFIAGRKDTELVTRGPYSLVRNPLYLFSFTGFLGAGLAFESFVLTGIMALIFLISHLPAIRHEEARLARRFGAEYDRYSREVPAFIPTLRVPARADLVPPSIRPASRALLEASLIPFVFIAANLLEWGKLARLIPVLILIP